MHIIINGWFSDQSGAGSGQYIDRLLDSLPTVAGDVRFTLLIPGNGTAQQGNEITHAPRTTHHAPRIAVQSPVPNPQSPLAKLWWEQVTVPWMARKLGGDVLFVPYWAAPWWQPVPTVVTIHDLIPILLPEYRGGWLQRAYFRLVSATARRASHIITVSEASKRDVVTHLGIDPARITPVHHGPNLSPPRPVESSAVAQARERYGLPERYFLYLGGFEVRKNVAGILAGYAAYLAKGGDPAVKLTLAGKLPTEDSPFTPDPRRLAQEAGVDLSQLHLPGWVDEADKAALYAGAVAFLFPSRYEGFGMMTLEAQSAGAPVISGG